jgi:hypothetical protein
MNPSNEHGRQLLRHTLATVAYRAGKALRGAPESSPISRPAILHGLPRKFLPTWATFTIGRWLPRGEKFWHDSQPLEWSMEVERFFAALKKFDDYLASSEPLHASIEKLFQGPIAHSLAHIGQIAMLRRIAGYPLKGENYFIAEISTGRVGVEQAAPPLEFD